MVLTGRRLGVAALLGAVVAAAVIVGLLRNSGSPGPGWVRVGSLQEVNEAGVVYLPESHVFVVANGPRPAALSAWSPHIPGERVLFCRSSGWFESLAHGEKFDRLGFYALGPAVHGMDRVAAKVMGGTVWVNPARITEGPPRGAQKPQPPAGPFCTGPEGSPGFAR